jgi:hypothetical protein
LTSAAVAGWTAATLVVVVEVDVDRSVGPIGAPVALSVGVVVVLRVVVVWVWAGAAGVPGTAVVVLRVVVVWVWSGVCWVVVEVVCCAEGWACAAATLEITRLMRPTGPLSPTCMLNLRFL